VLGAEDPGNGVIHYWVRDNGPGLTQEALERLFTPFERLDQVSLEGHGLGLSIVQRIISKLEGQVGLTSQAGEGSTFWFALPKATPFG
jgi:signal transduction histidine kinase